MGIAALQKLEALLSRIYDLGVVYRVADFLVTDRQALPHGCRDAPGDEQLFVSTAGDELRMSLYLEPALLERLRDRDPHHELNGHNVADFLTAVEGISHFLCVAHHAQHDRPVSVFALELQAEIDKYVTGYFLLRRREPQRFPAELHRLLFDRARVAAELAQGRDSLYRRASAYAARFCSKLAPRLRNASGAQGLAELRKFYRLCDGAKVAYIERMRAAS
jgi:hypothetical protein